MIQQKKSYQNHIKILNYDTVISNKSTKYLKSFKDNTQIGTQTAQIQITNKSFYLRIEYNFRKIIFSILQQTLHSLRAVGFIVLNLGIVGHLHDLRCIFSNKALTSFGQFVFRVDKARLEGYGCVTRDLFHFIIVFRNGGKNTHTAS